ncbi:SpoIID/LytB domain-containing protein [Spirulina sp. 06S082]|uniref:SpoIID/LytB domain-containing protein n=1 Tax=Spirulina sp. 06S082 TaxID=3110248 RepID=UPI002B1E9D91|nr:SpoIID/LytB domain-containing protein [Spirulina sp. 06S082]MEA5468802.1 SpoIID/LytB domain-containing protein [Spirulina sp. 06S082]
MKKTALFLLLPCTLSFLPALVFPNKAQTQAQTQAQIETETQRKISPEMEIDVGIVQRFGDEAGDRLTLSSTEGDTLTVKFQDGNGQLKTENVSNIVLEIAPKSVESPLLQEWIVLSDVATFETAENSALEWQEKGIEVEVVQPGRWQVWAKRETYNTPILRRMLLENLQERGETNPYLQSEVLNTVPIVSFVINGFRYNRSNLEITSNKNLIRVKEKDNTILFGGSLRVQPNSYGNFTLVNEVPIEVYLRGVVPHEIGPNAPYNSVEAQTVIARTYALRNLRRFQADNYELCATVHCQVYKGLTGTVANADRAIQATRGLVLTHNDELVDALYSAHTGGVTAQFEDIWDGKPRPYLRARIDGANPQWNLAQQPLNNEANFRRFISSKQGFNGTESPVFRWNRQSSIAQLTEDLNKYLEKTKHPLAGIKKILRMAVTERSPSGRILLFTIETDRGVVELQKTEARSAFGPPRSTLFYIDPILDASGNLTGYKFIGGGFGHGVGLNQYGSYTLANLGWKYDRILQFYYPGTVLQQLREGIVFYPES